MCSCADTWWQRPAPWCWQRGAFHVALLQGWPRWQHEISGVDPLRKLTGAKETPAQTGSECGKALTPCTSNHGNSLLGGSHQGLASLTCHTCRVRWWP